jgi:hypothetical protein
MHIDGVFFECSVVGVVGCPGTTTGRGRKEVGFFFHHVDDERQRNHSAKLHDEGLIDLYANLFTPITMHRVGKSEIDAVSSGLNPVACTETRPNATRHGFEHRLPHSQKLGQRR